MILNIAAYHFAQIDDPHALAAQLGQRAGVGALRGTILVAGEGINLFLAGEDAAIASFLDLLRADARFGVIAVKESRSRVQPFARLKVKVKPEIISFRRKAHRRWKHALRPWLPRCSRAGSRRDTTKPVARWCCWTRATGRKSAMAPSQAR
jgi:predicted sulfurtransferase